MQLVEFHTETGFRFCVNPEFVTNVFEKNGESAYHGTSITMSNGHQDIFLKEDYDTVIKLLGGVHREIGSQTLMVSGAGSVAPVFR